MACQKTVGEGLKGNEENISGNWGKGDPFYVQAESLAILPVVLM